MITHAPSHRALARVLDSMPQGFPATESGVELEILSRLFSPEEAELASLLTMRLETVEEIASRSGREAGELKESLKAMLRKGLVDAGKTPRGLGFKILPFVVGFYERQYGNIDREFAELFERYYKEGLVKAITMRPSSHRVIPVEKSIEQGAELMPYERASAYVEAAAAWGVLKCICRVQKRLVGQGCSHSVENCLALSSLPNAFARFEGIKALTKEEALQVLRKAEAEGLVHTTANSQANVTYICNCCTCSCGFLRATKEFGIAEPVSRAHFRSTVDAKVCTGCGACVEACQFGALALGSESIIEVDEARCVGCGLCVPECPSSALSLRRKGEAQLEAPPIAEGDWEFARALMRGLDKEYERLAGRHEAPIKPE